MFRRFMTALQFLTIIPVRRLEVSEAGMARSVTAFPLVGLVQGALLVGTAVISKTVFPPDLSAALVVLVLVVSNGGFHLDGLSDTFDALAKRGGIESKLEAMKDSRAGAIGVTAIVLSLLIKFLCLKSLSGLYNYYFFLLLMPVLSKWAMVVSMRYGTSARKDGIGKVFIEATGRTEVIKATLLALIIIGASLVFTSEDVVLKALVVSIAEVAVIFLFSLMAVRFCRRQFGGLTGDTLGATAELSEVVYLLMVLLWSRLYIY